MATPTLHDRIKGALTGAALGAEFGFSRFTNPERFKIAQPTDVFTVKLAPVSKDYEEPFEVTVPRSLAPFINLGVQAYIQKQGRVTPEDFGALLRDDAEIAGPVFAWDFVHTVQETLKEGMNPRISGLGCAPCGFIAAAMPAVGIYHFNDPAYAYLDGVELASVAQPRLGADWAALCAVAIAAAFNPESSPGVVVDTVLKTAHENNKNLFYQIRQPFGYLPGQAEERDFAVAWLSPAGQSLASHETNWTLFNPLRSALPLLGRFAGDPQKLFALILTPGPTSWYHFGFYNAGSAVIAGAIAGALHGTEVFPAEWREWVAPTVAQWLPLLDVVNARVKKEKEIISVTEELLKTQRDGLSLLHDKVYGCLLAGAIGNAMGSVVEGMHYDQIDEKYPDGITTILDASRLEGEDDNQMAMLLVETYLEREGLPVLARHFGKTWQERLNRDHFYAGCMGNSYDLICQGWDPRIVGHWSVVTGSTVMCMEPVGVYHLADPEFAAIDAMAVSYMYQRGLDMVAATMMAATVAEAFRPEATVESVLQAALGAAPKGPLQTFDKRPFKSAYDYIATCLDIADKYNDVLAVRGELYDKCLFYSAIDPLELWGFSLAMFKIAKGDIRQAAIGGTNIGRDSDTIAGRAAMLAGTLNGAGGVPKDWMALFKPEVLEKIKRNAGRFADLIVMKKERMKKRQIL